jgi:hypothetical protein
VDDNKRNLRNKVSRGDVDRRVSVAMPNRHWLHDTSLVALAVALAIFVAYLTALYQGIEMGQSMGAEYRAQIHHENADDYIQRVCFPLTGSEQTRCIQEAIETSGEHQRAEQDLAAQEGMAQWAWWLLVLTTVATAIATLGTVLLWLNLVAARDAVEQAAVGAKAAQAAVAVTRDMAIAQSRAYLHISKAEVFHLARGEPFPGHHSGDVFAIRLSVKNTGNTPAEWYQVEGICEFGVADELNVTTMEVVPIKTKRWGTVAPRSETSSPVMDLAIRVLFIKAAEAQSDAANGVVEMKGTLTYRTEFKETRSVPFAFFVKGEALQKRITMSFSDMQENKPKPIPMQRPELPLYGEED